MFGIMHAIFHIYIWNYICYSQCIYGIMYVIYGRDEDVRQDYGNDKRHKEEHKHEPVRLPRNRDLIYNTCGKFC